jgi:hypothetical protein
MIAQIKSMLPTLIENPPIVPEEISLPGRKVYLVQEGKMLFGTKQRAMFRFLSEIIKEQPKIDHTLYVGGYNASGPAAIAYASLKCGIKCTIIVAYKTEEKLNYFNNSRYKASLTALSAKIILVKTFGEARTIADKIRKESKKDSIYYPVMGFNTELWRTILTSQYRLAAIAGNLQIKQGTTIWVTAGTGSVAMSLNRAFPEANLGLFMTGSDKYKKIIEDWAKDRENVVLIPEIALEESPPIPYNTVANYDDFIWPYFYEFAIKNDIIWNIATDTIMPSS